MESFESTVDGMFAFGPGAAIAEAEVVFDVVEIAASADRLRRTTVVFVVVGWHTEEPGRNGAGRLDWPEAGRLGWSEIEQLDRADYEQVASADSYCEGELAPLQDIWTYEWWRVEERAAMWGAGGAWEDESTFEEP